MKERKSKKKWLLKRRNKQKKKRKKISEIQSAYFKSLKSAIKQGDHFCIDSNEREIPIISISDNFCFIQGVSVCPQKWFCNNFVKFKIFYHNYNQ